MRIRKRFHLLSSLSSDPPANNQSSVVQVQVQQDQQQQNGHSNLQFKKVNFQKSDLPNQASDGQHSEKATWVSQTNDFVSSSKNLEVLEVNDEQRISEERDGKEKNTSRSDIIIRKECTLNEEANISSLLAPFSPPSSDQVDGRGSEDELVVPLKKRKRSYKRSTKEDGDDHQYSNSEWKSKTNKRSTMFQDDDNLKLFVKTTQVYDGDSIANCSSSTTKRKKIRGGVLLEGSRCSRINGRGWRCCQPTLVGYSLCEHHLGKGRLRTMSNVVTARNRKQPMGTSAIAPKHDDEQTQEQPSWFLQGINQERIVVKRATKDGKRDDRYKDDDEEELPGVAVKKMKKLGKVRARSMSSLLLAIDNASMVASQQLPKQ